MDFSHNIKKIRNNIYASGDHEICKRKLKIKEKFVVWDHWINAYNWDRYDTLKMFKCDHLQMQNDCRSLNLSATCLYCVADSVTVDNNA